MFHRREPRDRQEEMMDVLYPVSAGIDVHRDTLVVTVSRAVERRARSETRTFGAVTEEVRALVAWLDEQEVPIVAMESTGVYWKPVYRAIRTLSATRTVWLVNPAHIKAVPGRKTDVKDSAWIAKLLMHGLLSPSFVPEVALLELRDLTRYRKKRVGEQASERNRVIKLLEASNVRLASVASDPLGKAGRAIIEALLAGDKTPEQIGETAGRRLRASQRDIARAVEGVLGDATRFLLRQMLAHIDQVDATIERLDARIAELLRPMSDACALVTEIPGINATTVAGVLAEIGTDMSMFPSADHLVSWGGLAPGSHESAGKRKPVATRRGSHWLRVFLVQAAWAATHAKGTFWKRTFERLRARLGPKQALIAIARKMLVALYHVLKNRTPYRELGADHVPTHQPERRAKKLVHQLKALGFDVQLAPTVAPT
jgi:transposase